MNNAVMFSSNSDEWATPQNLFDELNNEFNFDLDPCATEDNHKTPRYFDRNTNGLSQKWGGAVCSVILHIRRLANGWLRHTRKGINLAPLSFY